MDVGERGRLYTCRYAVTIRMTPALRWVAIRAIFYGSLIARDKVTNKTVSTDHNIVKRKQSRSGFEPRSFCLPA